MFPTITFATSCWERDWRHVLLNPDYLAVRQIENHQFPFAEKLLIINNVNDLESVKRAAQEKIDAGVLTRYVVAQGIPPLFQLTRSSFNEWQYYNALGPFTAIHECQSDYLLYLTGDVYLKKPVNWLPKALRLMQKHPYFKVANLAWNENYDEAAKEADFRTRNFFAAQQGVDGGRALFALSRPRRGPTHALPARCFLSAWNPTKTHQPRPGGRTGWRGRAWLKKSFGRAKSRSETSEHRP